MGCTITRIELRLEALSLTTPGQNLNGRGDWTDVDATLRIEFFGFRN